MVWFAGGEQSLMVGQGANGTLRMAIFVVDFFGALNCTQALCGGQTERRPITKGLAINWRDVVSFGFCLAMVLQSRRDVTHLALVFHSLNFLFYIEQRFRRKDFKYQFIAKPGSLPAILTATLKRLLKIFATLILFVIGLTIIRLQPKRIAYGHYAGECVGNCGTIYEVTNKVIHVDTTSFWETQNDLSKLQIKRQRFLEKDNVVNFDTKKITIPLIMLLDPRTIFGAVFLRGS